MQEIKSLSTMYVINGESNYESIYIKNFNFSTYIFFVSAALISICGVTKTLTVDYYYLEIFKTY